ncbi:MAG: hypothetical protein WCO54_01640 [Bacteroidota bacterium]
MKRRKIYFRKLYFTIISVVFCISFSTAQNSAAPKEKMSSSIQLAFNKKADNSKHITVKVSAKNSDNKRKPAENAHINFYAVNKDGEKNIGSCLTDNEGKSELLLPKDIPLDTAMTFHIVAKIENDELYENSDEVILFKDVTISIKLNAADSNRMVNATVVIIGSDGKEKPVKDVAVKFYIQRMFGIMPVAEDNSMNTDEAGLASFNYPKEIPGGSTGNLSVIAKIEDNEFFGTVETAADVKWGSVIEAEKNPFPRALWEPYAPPSLVIVICVLFGGVWSIYMFIFYTLYKIKKEKSNTQIEFDTFIKK